MKTLHGLTENLKLKTNNSHLRRGFGGQVKLKTFILYSLFFILYSASLGSVQAQEAIEIPGPELEDASFIPVKDLKIGDWVFVKSEEGLVAEQIAKLEYKQESVEVYNLSVDGEQTFFANGFAVHNKAGTDTTPPICRVIVNPTVSNVNSLVKNRSFESPVWRKNAARENCPTNWYNRDDGGKNNDQLWCDYGLAVDKGGRAGTAQHVDVGYPIFAGFQIITGLKNFGSQAGGVLYKTSAYGRTGRTGIGFGDHWQFICRYDRYDCNSKNWDTQGVLGWTNSGSERIWLKCYKCDEETGGTELDHISLQEMIGKTQVDDLNVNLYVAHKDDRQTRQLRHYNEGESPPGWVSGDPRVIYFGEEYKESDDPITHTLSAYGSQKIIVEVRDGSGNVGSCSRTVSSTAPTGTITGNVYKDGDFGKCDLQDPLEEGWSVTCNDIEAEKTGPTSYKCCAQSSGGVCTDDQLPHDDYLIEVNPPPATKYQRSSCSEEWSGDGSFRHPVTLNSDSAQADDLYLWQGFGPWYQTQGGDVQANSGTISSAIPDEDFYFSLANDEGFPGLVSYNSATLHDFGLGKVSEKGWLANDGYSVTYGYDYFYSKLGSPDTSFDCASNSPPSDGFYLANNPPGGECTINSDLDFGTNKVVIFVNGDLQFDSAVDQIKVSPEGFLAFIVKEDIRISGQIGDKSAGSFTGTTAHLQGVYIADGLIDTYQPDPSEEPGGGLGSGFRLVAAGIFVAKNGFNLDRNVKTDCSEGVCNETTPSELFIARPDLFVNIPDELREAYFFEQEVAP